jgi:hypothetical protein
VIVSGVGAGDVVVVAAELLLLLLPQALTHKPSATAVASVEASLTLEVLIPLLLGRKKSVALNLMDVELLYNGGSRSFDGGAGLVSSGHRH